MSSRRAPSTRPPSSGPGGRLRTGFTLVELIVVVVLTAGMMLVISLFLQRTLAASRRAEDDTKLSRQSLAMLDRLRLLARQSISGLHNFQSPLPFLVNRAYEETETLFFLTDFGQDGLREGHFIWHDRYHATNNANGTDKVIHAWKRLTSFPPAMQNDTMPPAMSAGSYTALMNYLRTPANFNAGGPPALHEGWEILLDGSADSTGARQVSIERWTPPPWTDPPGPPKGLAFNVASVVTGAPPLWAYTANPLLGLNGLSKPYPKFPAQALGAHGCQVYLDFYTDRNGNGVHDDEEARFQLITGINLLLVPSAGTASITCP